MVTQKKRREERHHRSKFQGGRKPHFFKIILSSAVRDRQLGIPRKFVMNYGEELSDVATLEVPNGRVWKVGLRKNNGDIWFHEGWPAFVEYHSIHHGHFLVFRYDGNSCFHVLIFDSSASEINYPCNPAIDEHNPSVEESPDPPIMNNETEEEEDSVEILGSSPTLLTKTKIMHESESEMTYQSSCKRNRNEVGIEGNNSNPIKRIRRRRFEFNSHDEMESISVPSDSSGDEAHMSYPLKSSFTIVRRCRWIKDTKPKSTGQIIARSGSVRGCPKVFVTRRAVTYQKKERGIHGIQNFTSEYPYFTVTMTPSYIHQNLMQVPSSFVKRYLSQKLNKLRHLTLRVSDGRTWTVNCSYNHLYARIRVRDRDGWGAFVVNNSLKEGDVCVFELIKMKNIEMEVTIFRVGDQVIQRTASARSDLFVDQKEGKLVTSQEKEVLLHATEAFTSQYPSFTVTVKPSHVRIKGLSLTVPSNFVKRYLTQEPEKLQQLMLQDSDGKIWIVNYSYLYNRFRLRKGWSAFAHGNGLKEGDKCVFRLIENKNIKLHVTIFRGGNVTDQRMIQRTESEEAMLMPVPRRRHSNVFVTKRAVAWKWKGRVIQAAEAFTSEYPFFTVTVRPAYLRNGFMHIPTSFVKGYLLQQSEKMKRVTLRVSDGRMWTVKCNYYDDGRLKLCKGWVAFVRENQLEEGDVCAFELIKMKNIELEVTIFRVVEDNICRVL